MSDSWLFERGESSVRIVRTGTLDFEVCGPGEHRQHHEFDGDDQLASFLGDTGERLTASGFRPRGYGTERRAADRPVEGVDRRRPPTA